MQKRFPATLAIAMFFALVQGAQADVITTLDGSQGWSSSDTRPGGQVGISTEQAPSGDMGSLKLFTTDATPGGTNAAKAGVQGLNRQPDGSYIPYGTLGDLANGNISFDIFKTSSTSATVFPSLRFLVKEGNNYAYLVWETDYNDRATTTNSFISENLTNNNFWMSNGGAIEKFDVKLSDWAGGNQYTVNGRTSTQLSQNSLIVAVETGVGSGISGTFTGYVDNINFSFVNTSGTSKAYAFNFEPSADPSAQAVPEPSVLVLGSIGTVLSLGYSWRRRKSAQS